MASDTAPPPQHPVRADKTPPEEIYRARDSGLIYAVKFYPQGATTNSDAGVTAIEKVQATLEAVQAVGMP